MLKVCLSGPLKAAADGAASVSISAATIRELLRELIEQYPGMQNQLDDGIAVSVNGQIFRDNWSKKIPAGAEIFLLPRIQGG
ncbi:MAG TPA: MoaD/ThiS family protein [Gammaproteobacteria bacterium]|jgi:molybdopterin converting factor small subunit|nr:MoaD/ThiS family protein [Gammaproteobacteria bacterium]HIM04243.1 MoaD/ThiS family protein [Gammaproteobacteria bacterium]